MFEVTSLTIEESNNVARTNTYSAKQRLAFEKEILQTSTTKVIAASAEKFLQ